MGDAKIIRNDRGLDFRRLERLVAIYNDKVDNKLREIRKLKDAEAAKLKIEAFKTLGIDNLLVKIKDVDDAIAALENTKTELKEKVMIATKSKSERYGRFDEVKEGSPVHNFITANCKKYEDSETKLYELKKLFAEDIWLAKDIDHAAEIVTGFTNKINEV